MSRPRLLIIQLSAVDPLGPLGDWFTEAGAELDERVFPDDGAPNTIDGYDGLVCIGTALSDGDTEHGDPRSSSFTGVRSLLGSAVSADSPTLCIGSAAQLLALTTGGQLTENDGDVDISPSILAKRDAAWVDPLCADLPLMQDVLHVSAEELVRLPAKAVLLSSSPRYPNQAFRLGGCVYGLPFHIETTSEIVRQWMALSSCAAFDELRPELDPDSLAQLHADVTETWSPFAHRFVELASGRLEPARVSPPTLPLAHG